MCVHACVRACVHACMRACVSPGNRTTCLSSPTAEVLHDIVKGQVTYTATAVLAHWILVDLAATQSALRQLLSAPSARCVHTLTCTTIQRTHCARPLSCITALWMSGLCKLTSNNEVEAHNSDLNRYITEVWMSRTQLLMK